MNTIKIKGMSCQHCVASVTKALEAIDGIKKVSVDLKKAEATYDGDIDLDSIKTAITKIGFEVD